MKNLFPAAAACFSAACATSAGAGGAGQDADPRFAAIRAYAADYAALASFDGVILIAEGDVIVFHEAFGKADHRFDRPMTTDARFRIASLSKQFTQGAVARLVDRDLIDLDVPVATYLPEFPNADRFTVRQLLEHSSGVAHTNRLDWMVMTEGMTLDQIIARLAEEPLDFEPGSSSRYSNGGYAVAAAVIEAVSGLSYADVVRAEFADDGFPSVGHEPPYAVVPGLAHSYAPGPKYGERTEATTYVVANRIGGGSLHATAQDVYRFFRASFTGGLVSEAMTETLFGMPEDGDILITGRSPGALSQIYFDENDDLTVVTLSSNSSWTGSFNADVTALYRGEVLALEPVVAAREPLTPKELAAIPGRFTPDRFRWNVEILAEDGRLVWTQDDIRTAFAKTESGQFHLPIWDWLCAFDDGHARFTCGLRYPRENAVEFVFTRADG